ncbi:MAG TPA: ankyrin repeat domain-containing protein [Methylophilaceae bacterium]
MRTIKAIFLAALLLLSTHVFAYTDDEQVEFCGAVVDGNIPVVKKYLDSGVMKVNDVFFGWAPILSATSQGQLPMVKFLVEHGANINYQHPITKLTPVATAAYDGNNELLEYLLKNGGNPNIQMRGGISVLRVTRKEGRTATADLLVKYGAKDDGCQDEKCF